MCNTIVHHFYEPNASIIGFIEMLGGSIEPQVHKLYRGLDLCFNIIFKLVNNKVKVPNCITG